MGNISDPQSVVLWNLYVVPLNGIALFPHICTQRDLWKKRKNREQKPLVENTGCLALEASCSQAESAVSREDRACWESEFWLWEDELWIYRWGAGGTMPFHGLGHKLRTVTHPFRPWAYSNWETDDITRCSKPLLCVRPSGPLMSLSPHPTPPPFCQKQCSFLCASIYSQMIPHELENIVRCICIGLIDFFYFLLLFSLFFFIHVWNLDVCVCVSYSGILSVKGIRNDDDDDLGQTESAGAESSYARR